MSKKITWDEAEEDAKENMIYVFPEGITNFTLINKGTIEKGAFKGKYIVEIEVDNKRKCASIGARQLIDLKKLKAKGATSFCMLRIGEGLDTRYKLSAIEPLDVV